MLIETTLPQDKRKDLEHHDYGVAEDKQFPLHDRKHVMKAIQMFRFAKEEDRKELAFKINLRADKYNIDIHKDHPMHPYLNEDCLNEKGFALTARYAGHRLLNASISNTLLQSVRVSLEKTVNGTTDPEDLQYLRQDMYMGKVDLAKRLARSTDAKQTKEIKEHLEWLSGPYAAMINKRAKELRSSLTEQLLVENKEAKKKGLVTVNLQTAIIKRNLEKMSSSGNEKLKDYSSRLDKARTKEEKVLIAEDIKNNIKELEAIKNDKDTSMVLRSLQVVGGIIIIIPGSFLMLGGGLIMLASSPVLILGGLIMALAGNAMALGGYLMSSKEVENKRMDKVLDIMITKHEKLLAKAK